MLCPEALLRSERAPYKRNRRPLKATLLRVFAEPARPLISALPQAPGEEKANLPQRRTIPTIVLDPPMLRPGSNALTTLLAMLTGLGPISMDMYLPSLP